MTGDKNVNHSDFYKYFTLKCERNYPNKPFPFSVRHYIHYKTKKIIAIMITMHKHIKKSKYEKDEKVFWLEFLYLVARDYMIPEIQINGDKIPKIYYKIEREYKLLKTRTW